MLGLRDFWPLSGASLGFLASLTLASGAEADAGAGGSTTAEAPSEEAAEAETDDEAGEESESATAEEPPIPHQPLHAEPTAEEPPAVPQAVAGPPVAPASEVGDLPPSRRDFLRRLRTTAEDVERIRASERTHARTEGDVTVLSNTEPLPRQDPPRPLAAPRDEPVHPEPEPNAAPAAAPPRDEEVAVPLVNRAPRNAPMAESGRWHWLWILGGVATALLLGIGMLLTRATRSG